MQKNVKKYTPMHCDGFEKKTNSVSFKLIFQNKNKKKPPK